MRITPNPSATITHTSVMTVAHPEPLYEYFGISTRFSPMLTTTPSNMAIGYRRLRFTATSVVNASNVKKWSACPTTSSLAEFAPSIA